MEQAQLGISATVSTRQGCQLSATKAAGAAHRPRCWWRPAAASRCSVVIVPLLGLGPRVLHGRRPELQGEQTGHGTVYYHVWRQQNGRQVRQATGLVVHGWFFAQVRTLNLRCWTCCPHAAWAAHLLSDRTLNVPLLRVALLELGGLDAALRCRAARAAQRAGLSWGSRPPTPHPTTTTTITHTHTHTYTHNSKMLYGAARVVQASLGCTFARPFPATSSRCMPVPSPSSRKRQPSHAASHRPSPRGSGPLPTRLGLLAALLHEIAPGAHALVPRLLPRLVVLRLALGHLLLLLELRLGALLLLVDLQARRRAAQARGDGSSVGHAGRPGSERGDGRGRPLWAQWKRRRPG